MVGRRVLAPALLAQCICFRYALRTQGRASCRDAGRRRGVVSRGLRPGDRAALASSFSTSIRRLVATCRRGRAGASRDSSTVASQTRRQDRATQLSSSALRHRARARLSLPPRPSSNDREWPILELQHSSSYSLRTSSRGEKRIGIAQLCLSISQLVMIFVTLIRKIVSQWHPVHLCVAHAIVETSLMQRLRVLSGILACGGIRVNIFPRSLSMVS